MKIAQPLPTKDPELTIQVTFRALMLLQFTTLMIRQDMLLILKVINLRMTLNAFSIQTKTLELHLKERAT